MPENPNQIMSHYFVSTTALSLDPKGSTEELQYKAAGVRNLPFYCRTPCDNCHWQLVVGRPPAVGGWGFTVGA